MIHEFLDVLQLVDLFSLHLLLFLLAVKENCVVLEVDLEHVGIVLFLLIV